MTDSSGICARIERKTDSPPTPESNMPMDEFEEFVISESITQRTSKLQKLFTIPWKDSVHNENHRFTPVRDPTRLYDAGDSAAHLESLLSCSTGSSCLQMG